MILIDKSCWPTTSIPNPFLDPLMLEEMPPAFSTQSSSFVTASAASTLATVVSSTYHSSSKKNSSPDISNSPIFPFGAVDGRWSPSGSGGTSSYGGTVNSLFASPLPLVPMVSCSTTSTNYSTQLSKGCTKTPPPGERSSLLLSLWFC